MHHFRKLCLTSKAMKTVLALGHDISLIYHSLHFELLKYKKWYALLGIILAVSMLELIYFLFNNMIFK